MSAGATFERVYLALREELGTGSLRAGGALEPSALASRLNASITPIRDALHRLVGERLVEAPRGDGFRVPLWTEMGLRYLYRWRERLLLGAIHPRHWPIVTTDGAGTGTAVHRAEAVFSLIGSFSGNPEHENAIEQASARLRPVRAAEEKVLADTLAECAALEEMLADGGAPLRRRLVAYHQRRIRAAAEIVALLHAE
ncbi:GntR family transcriptional regulator [Sphingosinicella sp. BN140058]|uniref:GntR family transcriptional regulator n=1 Tax=Sphingosinicella sp. BN140058 TaxID=1892855 RepID=UPI0013EA0EA1|nr:GntR family transcriptional regulator [Sphingosinicella sp. BN140058]